MGPRFFLLGTPARSGDAGDEAGAPETILEARDRQQAVVLGALRRAAGAPVSYAELRAAGVELPASVVSELELSGVAVERCSGSGSGSGCGSGTARGAVAVRLDPANDRPARAEAGAGTHTAPPRQKSVRVKPRGRVPALTALVAGIVVVVVAVALGTSGGGRRAAAPIATRVHSRAAVAVRSHASPPRALRPTQSPTAVPVSPALATELEAQGHSLLEDGQFGDAVAVLKRAVLATGESPGSCLDPASSTCLTYAYALYDLGRAMRLSGQPRAAVPILERRLQIDNQRSTVVAELQLARQGIS